MNFPRSLVGLLIGLFIIWPAHANERVVRKMFRDTPILINIARCESGFNQYDEDGKILKNPKSSAIGVMQIMSSLHRKEALRLGYNIQTLDGNLKYAKHLYEDEGTRPWNSSRKCWKRRSA